MDADVIAQQKSAADEIFGAPQPDVTSSNGFTPKPDIVDFDPYSSITTETGDLMTSPPGPEVPTGSEDPFNLGYAHDNGIAAAQFGINQPDSVPTQSQFGDFDFQNGAPAGPFGDTENLPPAPADDVGTVSPPAPDLVQNVEEREPEVDVVAMTPEAEVADTPVADTEDTGNVTVESSQPEIRDEVIPPFEDPVRSPVDHELSETKPEEEYPLDNPLQQDDLMVIPGTDDQQQPQVCPEVEEHLQDGVTP